MIQDIISAKIFNFVTHADSKVSFENDGSYLIVGSNMDNKSMNKNGVGKSLILDSFFFCLFGKCIRPAPLGTLVGSFSKYTKVSWIFRTLDNKIYRITRYRKHPKHKNRPIIQVSSDGVSWSENIGKETPTDTDRYIEKIVGMPYEAAISSILVTKLDPSLNFCLSRDSERKNVLTRLLNLDWIDRSLDKARKDHKRIVSELSLVNSQVTRLTDLVSLYKKTMFDSKVNYLEFDNNKKKRIRSLIKDKIYLGRILSMKKNNITRLVSKRKSLDKQISAIDSKDFSKQEKRHYYLTDKSRFVKMRLDDLKSQLSSINKLKDGYVCKFCGTKIVGENHRDKESSKITDKIRRYESKLVKLNRSIKRLGYSLSERDKYAALRSDINNRILLISSRIDNVSNNLIPSLRSIEKSIEDERSRKNSYEADYLKYKKEYFKHKSDLLSKNIIKASLSEELRECEYAMEAFGNSGIKNDIISSKIDLLEEKINEFLRIIADGDIYVRLDNKIQHGKLEKIGFMIKDSKKTNPVDYMVWSGGERTRVRFATELAINYIQDNSPNFLFVDEGFDELDDAGVKILLDMFTKERNKKMICISNRPDMQSLFKNNIKVVIENDRSTIVQKKKE